MRAPSPRRRAEPTIALINVVFLMLIFFLIAGTLAPPLDRDLDLVDTRDLEGRTPADALVIAADGTLRFRGVTVPGPGPYLAAVETGGVGRVVPDRAAPAVAVLNVATALRAAGMEKVVIVTAQAMQ